MSDKHNNTNTTPSSNSTITNSNDNHTTAVNKSDNNKPKVPQQPQSSGTIDDQSLNKAGSKDSSAAQSNKAKNTANDATSSNPSSSTNSSTLNDGSRHDQAQNYQSQYQQQPQHHHHQQQQQQQQYSHHYNQNYLNYNNLNYSNYNNNNPNSNNYYNKNHYGQNKSYNSNNIRQNYNNNQNSQRYNNNHISGNTNNKDNSSNHNNNPSLSAPSSSSSSTTNASSSNKNKYNNSKANHHHNSHHNQHQQNQQQQQQQQQQFLNYPYGANPQMYPYFVNSMGGYPMYGMPIPYGNVSTTPGQQYGAGTAGSSGNNTPQHQHAQISTPPPSKIKLTTKDGKPVDLEEKKKKTASSTPVASPHPSNVVPNSTPSVSGTNVPTNATAEKSTASSNAVNTEKAKAEVKPSSGLSAAEEFKRKILEKAAAAKQSKEKKEAKVEVSSTQPEAENEKECKVDSSVKSDDQDVKPSEKEAQVNLNKDNITESKVSDVAERPKTSIDEKDAKASLAEEVTKDTKPAEETSHDEEKVEVESKSAIDDDGNEVESSSKPSIESLTQETDKGQSDETHSQDQMESQPTEEGVSSKKEETSLNISQFLEKVKASNPIEDLLSKKYPDNIKAVDGSKQIPGKLYRYDPQFLIQFRDVIQYQIDPEFKTLLEEKDIHSMAFKRSSSIRDSSSRGGPTRTNSGLPTRFNGPNKGPGMSNGMGGFDANRQNSRTGSKRRGASSRDKSTRKGNASKRGGRGGSEMREKTEEELAKEAKPVEEVKPLEKSANRWVPKSRQAKTEVKYAEDGSIILDKSEVESKTKSLLNKLTLEMFNTITEEVLTISKQAKWEKDATTIKQIISLTFAKACDEPYWSEMYAKFCAKLCKEIDPEICDETTTNKEGKHSSGGVLARRILLTTCQEEYEKGWSDKLPTNEDGSPLEPEMMSDEYYAMAAAKRRGLGLVKFIGHLYNLNMLNDHVIFVCLKDQCKNTTDPSEDSLENLAQLVKTVGPKLDAMENTRQIVKFVFEYIDKILSGVQLSSRVKFMLLDLKDLRKDKWTSAKAESGPKTIEEIHRDAEIKRIEEEKAKNDKKRRHHQQGVSNDSRSNSSRAGSTWNNSFANSNSAFSKKPIPNQRTASSSSVQHPPASSASQDLQRETSKRSESTQINRFAALGDAEDDDNNENEDNE